MDADLDSESLTLQKEAIGELIRQVNLAVGMLGAKAGLGRKVWLAFASDLP